MSFTTAAAIVLAALVIALGLLAYSLLARLQLIEEAVEGGMRPPSHTLSRDDFARRFSAARARAALAKDVEHGVLVVVDDGAGSREIVRHLLHLANPRGFIVGHVGPVPAGLDRFATRTLTPTDLDDWGIAAVPYCLVVDDATIVHQRALADPAALEAVLLEIV